MSKSRHTEARIITALKQVEAGAQPRMLREYLDRLIRQVVNKRCRTNPAAVNPVFGRMGTLE